MQRKTRFQLAITIALFLVTLPDVLGQHLSVGFIGGTNLTRDFHTFRTDYVDSAFPGGLTSFFLYSDSHSLIAGPTIEVPLPKRFSVEIDALHRNLQLKIAYIPPGGQRVKEQGTSIGTWEFPLLLKYRLPLSKVQPFVELGPSFRVRKNPGSSDPRLYGITAGLGAEFRVGRFRIAPAIRYTRWAPDPPYPTTSTTPDQVELLTGISYDTSPDEWNLFGRRFRFGPVVGAVLTSGLEPNLRPGQPLSESQGYVTGLMTEFEVSRHFSLEIDGLYRPLRAHYGDRNVSFSVVTWQFPVLANYRVSAGPKFQPFVQAGPSFRLSGNFNGYDPSEIGFTTGAGIQLSLGRALQLTPAVRYTRWRTDFKSAQFHTLSNQVELLVGFSF